MEALIPHRNTVTIVYPTSHCQRYAGLRCFSNTKRTRGRSWGVQLKINTSPTGLTLVLGADIAWVCVLPSVICIDAPRVNIPYERYPRVSLRWKVRSPFWRFGWRVPDRINHQGIGKDRSGYKISLATHLYPHPSLQNVSILLAPPCCQKIVS